MTTRHVIELATTTFPSPVGELTLVASDAGLRAVLWPDDAPDRVRFELPLHESATHPVLVAAAVQLDAYFTGELTRFDVPLDLVGTPFQRSVWEGLAAIPYGHTATYGEQARRVGRPGSARAVGAATGRNPVSIVLPCHRVVGSNGKLTGFAGGLDTKRWLLAHEGSVVAPDR